jgi:LysR family transcriptional activator of nhaA
MVGLNDNGPMDRLNFHHLYYFWTIAQEGSLSRAATRLSLSHSTLSEQLKMLETYLGQELFARKGRRLVLTEFGAEVVQYAADIFHLGNELVQITRGRAQPRRSVFRVGVLESTPKTVVYRLLEPSIKLSGTLSLEVREGTLDVLLGWLSRNLVHVIIADQPPDSVASYRFNVHKLGDADIVLCGVPRLAVRYRPNFPASLAGAPMLLPAKDTYLRQSIDRWLADRSLEVNVVGEFDDAASLRTFGVFGLGLFPVRSIVAHEVEEARAVKRIGPITGVRETYYAVSHERRDTHPYIAAIINAAKQRMLLSARPKTRDRSRPARAGK